MDPLKPLAREWDALSQLEPARKVYSLVDEFKAFAFKGNVIDLAVGVIIGAAFGKIVDSLVKDLIMPLLGTITPGRMGYLGWAWVINGKPVPYGRFLGEVVNFLIVAAALFLFIVKFVGWLTRSGKEQATPPPTKQEALLAEIRDLLAADMARRKAD